MAWNYGGQPVGVWGKASNIQGGQRGGVPLATFGNRSGASPAVAAVLSPSSNFMASSQQSWAAGIERFVGLGLMGSVSEALAGTYRLAQRHIVHQIAAKAFHIMMLQR